MKRTLVLLVLAFLVLGVAASVYADGNDESQPPVLGEGTAPAPVQPEEAAPKDQSQPSGAPRGGISHRRHVRVPVPTPNLGKWGQCPLGGSTSKAEQELAIWARVTGVPVEELKKHLSSGVGPGEICGAVVVARKQGRSVTEVIGQAKADKVNMRVLAYAAGMSMDEFAKATSALHTAFLEQAVAEGLFTREQAAKGKEAPASGGVMRGPTDGRKAVVWIVPKLGMGRQRVVMPGPGLASQQMVRFARMRGMMLMHWKNMLRGPAGNPGQGK